MELLDLLYLLCPEKFEKPVTPTASSSFSSDIQVTTEIVNSMVAQATAQITHNTILPEEILKPYFIKEIYTPALEDLRNSGYCRKSYDPYNDPTALDVNVIVYYQDKDGKDTQENMITLMSDFKSVKDLKNLKGFMILSFVDVKGEDISIDMIYILPKYRYKGEGRKFLGLFMTQFEEYKNEYISVRAEVYNCNLASENLFLGAGFYPYATSYKFINGGWSTNEDNR